MRERLRGRISTTRRVFHPDAVSTPIEEADFGKLDPRTLAAEWKWDGIRVQLVLGRDGVSMFFADRRRHRCEFSRRRRNAAVGRAVLDGELLVGHDFDARSFNDLQQRLNRKVRRPRDG